MINGQSSNTGEANTSGIGDISKKRFRVFDEMCETIPDGLSAANILTSIIGHDFLSKYITQWYLDFRRGCTAKAGSYRGLSLEDAQQADEYGWINARK